MSTNTIISRDGARIALDIQGAGPGLVLLHGLSEYRELWHKYGWVEALTSRYTVITPDFRGAGDSEAVPWPEVHAITRYIEDFHAVLDAANLPNATIWGWSFGGGVALQFASRSPRVASAIASGTHFGRIFTPEIVEARLANVDRLEKARTMGDWTGIDDRQRRTAERTDFAAARARLKAAADWPVVEPADVIAPTLVLTGTQDGNAVIRLQEQLPKIETAGISLHVFDGLNHVQLVSQREIVQPVIDRFLKHYQK